MQHLAEERVLPRQVLEPLCQPFSNHADALLDLYEMTREPRQPGECVRCFYKLFGAADSRRITALDPLKAWIEQNVEITISAGERFAGTFPVRLEEPDLEQFCFGAMKRVREDTAIEGCEVALHLRYKESGGSAA